jgi:hypothetical protein
MRTATWLSSVLLATSFFAQQGKAPDNTDKAQSDPYHMIFVRSAFESFKESEKFGMVSGGQIKQFTNNFPSLTQLGDSVSVAVLKLYSLDELIKPENTRPYLTVVSLSFSDSHRVLDDTDRSPRVTSLVLNYLQQKVPAPRTKSIIDSLKTCTSTCSCPRIPNF